MSMHTFFGPPLGMKEGATDSTTSVIGGRPNGDPKRWSSTSGTDPNAPVANGGSRISGRGANAEGAKGGRTISAPDANLDGANDGSTISVGGANRGGNAANGGGTVNVVVKQISLLRVCRKNDSSVDVFN